MLHERSARTTAVRKGGDNTKGSDFIPSVELYDKPEYHYSWWGGVLLAKSLITAIERGDRRLSQPKNIINLLQFLMKSKANMLNFMYHEDLVICTAPIKDKKGKVKEYKPYCLMFNSGTSEKLAAELEFISPPEKKWRDTAKVLLESLNNACGALSALTGKSPDEIFNNLLNGETIEAPPKEETGENVKSIAGLNKQVRYAVSEAPPPENIQPAIIVDFFAGSSTTAHAAMQLNAEDGGRRKFIMVQSAEPCAENSEAYKAGYKTIAEIGKERIRRAAKKIAAEKPDAKFDRGFKVYKLAERKNGNCSVPSDGIVTLSTILQTAMKAAGLPEDTPVSETTILGKRFWIIGDNDVIVADSGGTTLTQAQEIIKMCPRHIGLLDASREVKELISKYLEEHKGVKL